MEQALHEEILAELRDQRTILVDLVSRVAAMETKVGVFLGNGHPGRISMLESAVTGLVSQPPAWCAAAHCGKRLDGVEVQLEELEQSRTRMDVRWAGLIGGLTILISIVINFREGILRLLGLK